MHDRHDARDDVHRSRDEEGAAIDKERQPRGHEDGGAGQQEVLDPHVADQDGSGIIPPKKGEHAAGNREQRRHQGQAQDPLTHRANDRKDPRPVFRSRPFSGRLCSGALHGNEDGPVTEAGWVADLVNREIPVGDMLCPGKPAQVSETYNDLLNLDTSSAAFSQCLDRLGSRTRFLPDGTPVTNPCRQIAEAGLPPGSEPRRQLVDERVLKSSLEVEGERLHSLVRDTATEIERVAVG